MTDLRERLAKAIYEANPLAGPHEEEPWDFIEDKQFRREIYNLADAALSVFADWLEGEPQARRLSDIAVENINNRIGSPNATKVEEGDLIVARRIMAALAQSIRKDVNDE